MRKQRKSNVLKTTTVPALKTGFKGRGILFSEPPGAGQRGKGRCWDKDGTFDRDICWGSARGGMSRHCYSKKRSRTKHCMKPENKNSKYCRCHFGENSKNLNPRDQYIGTPAYGKYTKGHGWKKNNATKVWENFMRKEREKRIKALEQKGGGSLYRTLG